MNLYVHQTCCSIAPSMDQGANGSATAPANISIVVGNPRTCSRTRLVAEALAGTVAKALGQTGGALDADVIELAEFGGRVLDDADAEVDLVLERVRASDCLVVASPVYKASYTGLLKGFLDRIPGAGLTGVVAVPVMVAGTPRHALALEAHLRPLLVELGASCPTSGFFITEQQLDDLAGAAVAWGEAAASSLAGARRGQLAGVGR